MLNMGNYGSGARWHLDIAVAKNDLKLAKWLLTHGASPNADAASDQRFLQSTLYEEAQRRGYTEMADLLVRFGATLSAPIVIEGVEAFAAACFRLDREEAKVLLGALYHNLPLMIEFLSRLTRDVFRLTWIGNIERLREVLSGEPDLAKSVDDGNTPLVWLPDDEPRAIEIVELLVAHGADPTIRNREGMTAADHAEKRGLYDVAELLRSMERISS